MMSAPVLHPGDRVILQLPLHTQGGIPDRRTLNELMEILVENFKSQGVHVLSCNASTLCPSVTVVAVFRDKP